MNKKIFLILFVIIIAAVSTVIYQQNNKKVKKEKEVEIKTDASTFKEEYESLNDKTNESGKEYVHVEIDEENPIKYSSYTEIMDILKNGTGVIYFGFPECPWCRNAVPVLFDAAKEMGIDSIYYFNALSMRDKKSLDDNGNIVVEEEGTE